MAEKVEVNVTKSAGFGLLGILFFFIFLFLFWDHWDLVNRAFVGIMENWAENGIRFGEITP